MQQLQQRSWGSSQHSETETLEVLYPTVPTANHRAAEKNIESIPPACLFLPQPKHSIPNPICYLTCTAGLTTTNSKSTITRSLLPPNKTNPSHRFSSSILTVDHPIFFLHVPHHHLHIFFLSTIIVDNNLFSSFSHTTAKHKSKMAGGKGKSSGGKSSGGKTSAAEGPKKQQSHSARAGLQVSNHHTVVPKRSQSSSSFDSILDSIPLYDQNSSMPPEKYACRPPFLERFIPCLCASPRIRDNTSISILHRTTAAVRASPLMHLFSEEDSTSFFR